MTNFPTDTFWDIDGTSLQTYSHNIETLGGGRDSVPPFRGANVVVPYRAGALWRPKVPDSRVVTLGMWVRGTDESGGLSPEAGQDPEGMFWYNYRNLKRLLWRDGGEQLTLTRRWNEWDGSGARRLMTASALAEFAGGLDLAMFGQWMGKFAVDLRLADPYFFGAPSTTSLELDVPADVTNFGDATVQGTHLTIVLNGPLTNPVITNDVPDPPVWVRYGHIIDPGDSVTLGIDLFTAIQQSDGGSVIGYITHSGARAWMALLRGINSLTLTADAGTGSADVTFQPPYL